MKSQRVLLRLEIPTRMSRMNNRILKVGDCCRSDRWKSRHGQSHGRVTQRSAPAEMWRNELHEKNRFVSHGRILGLSFVLAHHGKRSDLNATLHVRVL